MQNRHAFCKIVTVKIAFIFLTFGALSASTAFSAGIPALEERAGKGDAEAQVELARDCLYGQGVPENPEKAFALFEQAAATGNVDAKAALGFLYLSGKGTKTDEAKGIGLLREAASAGSPKAAYNLAQHQIKKGPEYSKEALDLMTKAVDSGMPEAELALADWNYFGKDGIPTDYGKAYPLYLRAAEKGSPAAQNAVGAMLYHGEGVSADRKLGAEYYRKAAEQGLAKAQANLGLLYIMGDVFGRNKVEGLKWLFRANAQGEVTARNALKDFLRGVNEVEIEEAVKTSGILRSSALNLEDPPAPNPKK